MWLTTQNFLYMMFAIPTAPYQVNKLHAEVIDTFLSIHADHEQNASTSTVRTAGSSLANPYACIATGVTSLWGRAHGGANESVVDMLTRIDSADNVPAFIEQVKRREVRLMGFGHRVYKNYDPRAKIMQDLCHRVFEQMDERDPLWDIAKKLEAAALQDDYFLSRKLYPNVDFYSGIVMRALGIPKEMFTVMFAMGRCVGWLSHWKEMVEQGQVVSHLDHTVKPFACSHRESHDRDNCISVIRLETFQLWKYIDPMISTSMTVHGAQLKTKTTLQPCRLPPPANRKIPQQCR